MPRYDIVIPHYGANPLLTSLCCSCLRSIARYSQDYRIIFIDNASPEFSEVEPYLREHPHLLVRNTSNQGFIRAVNSGIRLSTAPFVVLLNNDTLAVPGWLQKLESALNVSCDAGLAGPRTTTPGSWQGTWVPRSDRPLVLPTTAMLAFFCVMIRREVIDKVGLLDESYGIGFADDDDYCHRAHKARFRLVLVQDLVIPHLHRSTFRTMFTDPQIRLMQDRARQAYRNSLCR